MSTLAFIDFVYLAPIAGLFAVAAGVWWLLDLFASRNQRTEERLEWLKDPASRRRQEQDASVKKSETMAKGLEMASPALAKPLQPKSESQTKIIACGISQRGGTNHLFGI